LNALENSFPGNLSCPGRSLKKALHRIQVNLLQWFKENARDLPWRKTSDPYAIWISEIMLQQTQVPTVIPYYQRFLKTFPTVRHLAETDLSKILKIWEGLGYYTRARNLHKASQVISNHFEGRIPDNLKDLLRLPGIGRYTAGAILSIAYNKEAPIVDGNVKRVLSRIFGVSTDPKQKKTEALLWNISESLIPKGHASAFNQGLMDLGSMICIPREPQCPECPLRNLCKARASGNPEKYPSKVIRKAVPRIEAVAAIIRKGGKVLLKQRPPKGLLGGLWEFPNWNVDGGNDLERELKNCLKKEMDLVAKVGNPAGMYQQTFSHFKLTLYVYPCHVVKGAAEGKWVFIKNLHLFPMSRIHRRIAKTLK
jgi:A/G-specific adenine glycosylase